MHPWYSSIRANLEKGFINSRLGDPARPRCTSRAQRVPAVHQHGARADSWRSAAISRLAFSPGVGYQAPMSDESIDELARKLAESVPGSLRAMRADLEANFRSVLAAGLGRLDLVTREEFEVQRAVLARTREKLEALERRLEELETD